MNRIRTADDDAFERLLRERLAARSVTIDVALDPHGPLEVTGRDDRVHGMRPPRRMFLLAVAGPLVTLIGGALLWSRLANDGTNVATRSKATPATTRWAIYLDPAVADDDRIAIRTALGTDADVASSTYLDRDATYRRFHDLFAEAGPELLDTVRPDDLPTSFRVRLNRGADTEAFQRRYRVLPGVLDVDADRSGPSQSPTEAARDDVEPAVARLPLGDRVHELAAVGALPPSIDAPEGRWVISALSPRATADSYSEILLTDHDSGGIERAIPFRGLRPQGLLLTDDALYCIRQGDGGVPTSLVCRIDRRTFGTVVRALPFAAAALWDPPADGVPAGWSYGPPLDYAAFGKLMLRGTQEDGTLLAFGQGGSLSFDPRTLAVVGNGECEQPSDPSDQTVDTNRDLQLARIQGWDPVTRRLRFNAVGWGGPTTDTEFSILDDVADTASAPVDDGVNVWLTLTSGGPDLDRSDDAGIAALARPGDAIAWLAFDRGTVTRICEQYVP